VIVKVSSVESGPTPGKYEPLPSYPHEVDLCALSKDYFGVLLAVLNAEPPSHSNVYRMRFLLSDTNSNRVEDASGHLICMLRIPPSMTAGLRFEGPADGLFYTRGLRAGFDFDESDALHEIGHGECQLQHPVGHYDLEELRK
jgi:hypothetical protein